MAEPLLFGPFRLDADAGSLARGGRSVELAPRPFALLRYLAEHSGRVVTKEELLDAVWPGVFVGDAVLKVAVREIRKALDDPADAPLFIETVHGRGYRFRGGSRPSRLPLPLTSFIGRDAEVSALEAATGCQRLITLKGPGGVGKTRLAREVVGRERDRFRDGVWWIDLAGLDRPDLVVPALAATLGIRDHKDLPLTDALADFVRQRDLLVLLDNCEHVLAGCVPIVKTLLGAGPRLIVLTTSREPLGLPGEKVFVVAPLDVPPATASGVVRETTAAVELFIERARDADASFTASPEIISTIAAICRHLDGLPLAIEIVAARSAALSPSDLLARVEAGLTTVARDRGVDIGRHRSLEAVFNWSYDLLEMEAQDFLQRLSIFPGTFSLRAAQAICQRTDGTTHDQLAILVDKSLVSTVSGNAPADRRYRLLEIIRACVREKAPASVHTELAARHAAWFASMAEELRPLLNGNQRQEATAALSLERDNFRIALDWAFTTDSAMAIQLAANLWWWWFHTNQWREGRNVLERALEGSRAPDAYQAEALCGAGALAWFQGDQNQAHARLNQAIAVARTAGAGSVLVRALDFQAHVEADYHKFDAALALAHEAISIAQTIDNQWEHAIALVGLGNVLLFHGDTSEAQRAYEKSVAIIRIIRDPWALGMALRNLGVATRRRGNIVESQALLCESLQSLLETNDSWFVSRGLEELAKTLASRSQWPRVAMLLGAAEALRETAGAVLLAARRQEYDDVVAGARTALGDAAFDDCWARGRSLSREQAVAHAMDVDASASS